MGNILKITAENPEELLAANLYGTGALIRVERSATGGGTGYSEIGTLALVSGTYLYTYYDQTAATGSWYRTRYSNVGNTNRSDYSDEFQATTDVQGYVSLYDVKQALNKVPSDTSDDEELLQYIRQAKTFLDTKVSRSFSPDPTTSYTFDGYDAVGQFPAYGIATGIPHGNTLLVPGGVQSISQIQIASITGGTLTTLASTDVVLRPLPWRRDPGWPATQLVLTDVAAWRWWPPGYGNIIATGVFGWDHIPSDIEAITRRLVIGAFRGRSTGGGDLYTIGLAGERTFEHVLSWEDKATLKAYDASVYVG
jgi:hypothetical protein